MFAAVTVYALFALAFVVNKWTLSMVAPLTLVGMRLCVGGIGALFVACILRFKPIVFAKKDLVAWCGVLVFNVLGTNVLEIFALQRVFAAKAALIYTLSPFIGALVGYCCGHQRLSVRQWGGLLLGFFGVVYATLARWPGGTTGGIAGAELLLLGAVCSTVIGWTFVRQLIVQGYDPLQINGWTMAAGGLMALTVATGWQCSLPEINGYALLGITIAAALGTTGYVWYAALLRRYSIVFMTFASFASPLLTAFFGLLFLHEPITAALLICLACVSCGLYLFYCDEIS